MAPPLHRRPRHKARPSFPLVAIELIPDTDMGGFTAFIPDLPALGEGKTEEEAIADLKEGIQLYIDEFGLEEALSRVMKLSHIRGVNFGELVTHG
ncbi:type II toxin-antitoxin system HicB family antitoxin [Candidatus Peregrinibacteria bacterium]|nr:type II toxin-antitoxin system HicB family antitoxin [Candidatus Peregrinibacteria bacterium]MBI3816400.1 type II toxin-antitoxin system HicB family antitoxin [Candidatus Peregrinibacteria bacterium]